MGTRETRYEVDFPVFLSWQRGSSLHRVTARCVNLSPTGAKLETKDPLELRACGLMHSSEFGRMGMASVRYCRRNLMKYEVGLQFGATFALGDPVRRQMLERVLTKSAAAASS